MKSLCNPMVIYIKILNLIFHNLKRKKKKITEHTCRLAGAPTNRSPSPVKAITEGVVLAPSEFSITLGVEPSITDTQELVVPRSIPMTCPCTVLKS